MDKDRPASSAEASESTEDKIARKIAAGQERHRARSAVRTVVEDHPIALLAGGLLLGALLARVLPRSAFSKLGRQAAGLATVGAELATLYGTKVATTAGEAAREGREKLGDLGEAVGETAADARRRSADLAEVAINSAKAVGVTALRRVSEAAAKVRH